MNRHRGWIVFFVLALTALMAGCLGSSKDTSLDVAVAPQPGKVGSEQCTNTCHAATKDITLSPIAASWSDPENIHTQDAGVQCEDCHGGGGNHWGVGPIPYPEPRSAECNACHGFTGFDNTLHANGDSLPPPDFLNSPFGDGTGQAALFGVPVLKADNVTIVTKAEQLEECSRCHNSNQRVDYNFDGSPAKPDPSDLPIPQVTCGNCHDAHFAAKDVIIPQRADEVGYPVFRKYFVAPTGEQITSTNPADQFAAFIYQPNGAVKANGTLDNSSVVGKNNELTVERLCASCHTKGKYKYSAFADNGADVSTTHQEDIYTEWTKSGHGNRNAPAFAEFSANPPAYTNPNTGLPYELGSHQSSYPIDMALSSFEETGPANTTRNAGKNNYACFKCHNGIGSLAYQENVEGTPDAPVVFGDETVTCITCHDPHADVPGQTKNTRKPVMMTDYSSGGLTFSGNVFLDNTPVPAATGNETICVFCHQGRESGFTLFKRKLASGATITGNFFNPHYLGTGAMLWGRNGYEFGGKLYGEVAQHQQTNCNGCHMAAGATEEVGGHTWKIVSEDDSVVNSATCNAAACHDGQVPTTNSAGEFDDFRDTVLDPTNDYDGNGSAEGISVEIAGLENLVISLLDNNGISYDDTSYPYFFIKGTTNSFTAWTRPTLKAAFNLAFVIKGLPSGASQIGEPNPSAAVHNYRYNIQILMDAYEDLYNNTPGVNPALPTPAALLASRPVGTRAATNYNPQPGGGYDPLQ